MKKLNLITAAAFSTVLAANAALGSDDLETNWLAKAESSQNLHDKAKSEIESAPEDQVGELRNMIIVEKAREQSAKSAIRSFPSSASSQALVSSQTTTECNSEPCN